MSFDWSQYLVEEEPIVNTESGTITQPEFQLNETETIEPEQEKIDWSQYSEENKQYGDIPRHIARTASRLGESLVGLPGDVVSFVKWIDSKMPELPKFLKKDPNFLQKQGKKLVESFPTSSELQTKMSEITSGFTDPQSAMEEFGDSITSLATMLAMGKDPTKIKNLLSSIGKATAATTAGKTAEKYGVGEKGQLATEMGTLFMMGLLDKNMAGKYINDKFKKARSLIKPGDNINTVQLTNSLESLEQELSRGISTSTKNEVKTSVSELKNKISSGNFPADELVESYHDINERLASKKLFDELSKTEKKKLKFRYDKFKSDVGKTIGKYGKQDNPEFLKEWLEANEGFASLEKSKNVTKFLEFHMGKLPSKVAGSMAVELFMGHPEFAAATAGSFGAIKTGELLYRIGKSPTLRKHYLEALKAASEENLPAFIKSTSKLDDELKKSFTN